jgi:hypothetical protein
LVGGIVRSLVDSIVGSRADLSFFHMKLAKKAASEEKCQDCGCLRHEVLDSYTVYQTTGTTPWKAYTTILLNNNKQQCSSNRCSVPCWSSSSQSPRNSNSSNKCSTKADSNNSNNLRMLVQTRPGTSRDMKMVCPRNYKTTNAHATMFNNSL